MSLKFRILSCLFAASVLASPVFGQFETGAVLGTVRDASGAVVPEAALTLENVATHVETQVNSGENGNFEFFNVRIGQYTIRAEKKGFAIAAAEQFSVEIGARQRVDLQMNVGTASQTVEVSAGARALETDSSDRGQVIGREQIVNLPLNGRSYADLALLAPGVRSSVLSYTGEGGRPRNASFNVNGLRSSLNNFTIDGIDNNSYGTSNQGFSNQVVQISPDALEEFKVVTNNFSAEYGRAGGAVINASVRSGTNEFHGAAWEFLRNTSLNAVGFFKPLEGRKPTLIQNQFGGAIGGPILKNKLFFFTDYEGYRRVTRQFSLATVPTLAQRGGFIHNASGAPLTVVNPLSGVVYADGRIPATQISAFANKVYGELPAPNRPGIANNFESLPRNNQIDDKGDVKIDYFLNSKFSFLGRYSHRLATATENASLPLPSGGASNGLVRETNKQGLFGATYTISPISLVDFRMGISRSEGGRRPLDIGNGNMRTLYGITGITEDPEYAGGLNSQQVGGYTNMGRSAANPQFQNPTVYNPKVNYSRQIGTLSMKTGYEYQHISTEIQDFTPQYGRDQYSGQFSRPASASVNSIYNVADFLLGLRSVYDAASVLVAQYRQQMHFFYFQGDWKVNRKLTLNLGTRYEFATPQYEAQNRLSNFDPTTRALVPATGGSLRNRSGVNPDYNNWAPRVGLAYSISPKTVIRSGFGTSYMHFNRLGGENILSGNIPWVLRPTINQVPGQGLCGVNQAPQTCFRTTQQSYPEGFLDPRNVSSATSRTIFMPTNLPTGYTMSWHFTIQRELAKNLVLDVAYVGNRTNKMLLLGDLNIARYNRPGENLNVEARRTIPGFTSIFSATPQAWANYNALQAKLEKRFSNGLYILNSFAWSKAMDNAAGHLESFYGDDSRNNIFNLSNEKGVSSYNQTLANTTSVVWDLPFGRGRKFGSSFSGPLNYVAGGWRISVINTMGSGLPATLRYNTVARQNIGSLGVAIRPNIVTSQIYTPGGEWFNYLNPGAVQAVPATNGNPFGNAGRNTVRGDALYQTDIGLHKTFPLFSERYRLEFRGEAFNLLNVTNFVPPETNISSIGYGQITSTRAPRQIQFALKFLF